MILGIWSISLKSSWCCSRAADSTTFDTTFKLLTAWPIIDIHIIDEHFHKSYQFSEQHHTCCLQKTYLTNCCIIRRKVDQNTVNFDPLIWLRSACEFTVESFLIDFCQIHQGSASACIQTLGHRLGVTFALQRNCD